ncbi:serine--tRNA ligase, partial [Mycoplasmopsis synoviae]
MLNIKYILENKELVRDKLISHNFDIIVFDNFLNLAQERGKLISSAKEQKSNLTKLS